MEEREKRGMAFPFFCPGTVARTAGNAAFRGELVLHQCCRGARCAGGVLKSVVRLFRGSNVRWGRLLRFPPIFGGRRLPWLRDWARRRRVELPPEAASSLKRTGTRGSDRVFQRRRRCALPLFPFSIPRRPGRIFPVYEAARIGGRSRLASLFHGGREPRMKMKNNRYLISGTLIYKMISVLVWVKIIIFTKQAGKDKNKDVIR